MMQPIYLYGAGGLGKEVLALLIGLNKWQPAGYFDDNPSASKLPLPYLGGIAEAITSKESLSMVIAIGDPKMKLALVNKLEQNKKISFPHLVHPTSQLLDTSTISIGNGSILTPGCVLTADIEVKSHVLINLNVTIGHDVNIGKGCSIMPGVNIAGNVQLGQGVLVGSGANILNGITVGDYARIGAGAVVTKNVEANTTVVGVPAKKISVG